MKIGKAKGLIYLMFGVALLTSRKRGNVFGSKVGG
jgi:hypothetical protein